MKGNKSQLNTKIHIVLLTLHNDQQAKNAFRKIYCGHPIISVVKYKPYKFENLLTVA